MPNSEMQGAEEFEIVLQRPTENIFEAMMRNHAELLEALRANATLRAREAELVAERDAARAAGLREAEPLHHALKAMLALAKVALPAREHVQLGIEVNSAIARYEYAIAALTPPAISSADGPVTEVSA